MATFGWASLVAALDRLTQPAGLPAPLHTTPVSTVTLLRAEIFVKELCASFHF